MNLTQQSNLTDLTASNKSMGQLPIDAKSVLSNDLEKRFGEFRCSSAAFRDFEKKTGVSERQAKRYLKQESFPQFLNLKAIYLYLYKCYDYTKLLSLVHPEIKKALEDRDPISSYDCSDISFSNDYSRELIESPAFNYFYWKSADGGIVSEEMAISKFGDYGLKVLACMVKRNILKQIYKDAYTGGGKRSAPVNFAAVKKSSISLIKDHFSTEMAKEEGNNYLGFNVLRFDETNYQVALQKLYNVNRELIKLSEQNSSAETKQCFTVSCMDSMDSDPSDCFIEGEI